MKHIRIIGLCLVAVFAFGAVAAASASAEEVLFLLGNGKFPATFTDKGGAAKLVTPGLGTVECKEVTSKGTIGNGKREEETGSKKEVAHLGQSEFKFKGCKFANVIACSNAAAEEIVVASSWFHLGLVDPGDKPGILQLLPGAPETSEAGGEVKFTCGPEKVSVVGDVIGELQNEKGASWPIGEHIKKPKLAFAEEKELQKYKEFLLSLTKPENILMKEQDLKANGKLAIEVATGTLEAIKNSAGEETTLGLKKE